MPKKRKIPKAKSKRDLKAPKISRKIPRIYLFGVGGSVALALTVFYLLIPGGSPPVGNGSIRAFANLDGSRVSGWNAYAVSNFGIPTDTLFCSNLNLGVSFQGLVPGGWTVFGTYNTLQANAPAQVEGGSESSVILNFGSVIPPKPLVFTKYSGNPVFGPSLGWENGIVGEADVLYDGGVFKMWYRGSSGSTSSLGYATSPDGISWTKQSVTPIMVGNSFPVVLKVSSSYYLFQTNMVDYCLYRWSSTNGLTWTKDNGGLPILRLGSNNNDWDSRMIANTAVYYNTSISPPWRMLYEAKGWTTGVFQIGYATSTDGLSWTKYSGSPILPKSGGFQEAGNPSQILFVAGRFHLWTGLVSAGSWKVYHLTSTDLITWSSPTLTLGTDYGWEGIHVTDPTITYGPNRRLYLFYIGGQTHLGLALQDED